MTHRDEVRRLLGPHDPGDLSYSQDISLGDVAMLNLCKGVRLKKYRRLRRRKTLSRGLRPDIDHPCPPRLIKMRKFSHSLCQIRWLPRPDGRIIGAGENGSQAMRDRRIRVSLS